MKAVRIHRYGGPEVLVYEEVERPSPGPRQVLVHLAAISVNPIDVAVREDRFPTPRQPPKIIGSDGAGTVAEVGGEVEGVVPGDEVFFTGLGVGSEGSYAEYALIADTQAVVKPPDLPFPEAAAMGLVFSTAYYALVRRGKLEQGETVLVQGGAGGVGTASVQLAKALGARVIATVGRDADVTRLLELGADAVINYRSADVVSEVKRLTDGHGVDLVHELVVSANLATDLELVVRGGRVVCTGQGPEPRVEIPIGPALGADATLLFMSTSNAGRAGVAEMLHEISGLHAQGKIAAVIGATLPLAHARAAHEALAGPHFGKIVLVP